jgi:hypothetical protein
MSVEKLPSHFPWVPHPQADPAPEIWEIIRQLDIQQQARFAQVVLEAQIGIAQAHLAGLEKISGMVREIAG